jgi:hypothetical protein
MHREDRRGTAHRAAEAYGLTQSQKFKSNALEHGAGMTQSLKQVMFIDFKNFEGFRD